MQQADPGRRIPMTNRLLDPIELTALVAVAEGEASDSSVELLQVFTADGKLLGLAPRLLCHRLGLLHKAVFCFVGAPDGRLLLQTRKGGRLDVAVGGHLSSEDKSAEDAIIREIREEIGFELGADRLSNIAEYQRHSGDRLSKPREVNNELRVLFFVGLSGSECQTLDSRFRDRQDKKSILAVQWFSLGDVLAACDTDKAADGLSASISHYLLWLEHHRLSLRGFIGPST
jgi:8-oxo-dGTP pyrophosphatase MutT (NUDIX family)